MESPVLHVLSARVPKRRKRQFLLAHSNVRRRVMPLLAHSYVRDHITCERTL